MSESNDETSPVTINHMIDMLTQAKEELGGDTECRLHISCNGKADYVELDNLSYSKIFGLSTEIRAPWWVYK